MCQKARQPIFLSPNSPRRGETRLRPLSGPHMVSGVWSLWGSVVAFSPKRDIITKGIPYSVPLVSQVLSKRDTTE